jgi:hypothetical protein
MRRSTAVTVAAAAAAATVATITMMRPAADPPAWHQPAAPTTTTAPPSSTAPNTPGPAPLALPAPTPDDWWSWAAVDTRTGRPLGAGGASGPTETASMIKPWIAADWLRRHRHPSRAGLADVDAAIRDSDDQAAERLYLDGGGEAVIRRAVTTCRLSDTRIVDGWWSLTTLTATDAARLGWCLATGRAAGPRATPRILADMRSVRGTGRFGIVEGLAATADTVAIKNGWVLLDDGRWRVNCLAIGDGWSLAVLTRYSTRHGGIEHGAATCERIGRWFATGGR